MSDNDLIRRGDVLAIVGHMKFSKAAYDAHMRIEAITPAPEVQALVDALQAALNEADGVKITAWEDAARAAIAKARGADFAPRSSNVGQNDA